MSSQYQAGQLITILGTTSCPTTYTIPLSMMKLDTYEVVDATLDLYDWRDSTGALHRKVCDNKQFKCEFQTKNMLTDQEFANLMSAIQNRYNTPNEKRCTIRVFVPETGQYVTRKVYVPDIKVKIHHNRQYTQNNITYNRLYYDSVRIAFIDYSEGDQQ